MRLLLADGTVVDGGKERRADVLVDKGRIAAVGKDLGRPGERGLTVVDCSGCKVLPGLVDMHAHVREPGREDEETVASAARAALAGGFTDVVAMANTEPAADSAAVVEFVLCASDEVRAARVHPVGALTKGLAGEQLAEMWDMARAGAVAFSDDGRSPADACIMRHALEYAKGVGRPVLAHCEDLRLADGGAMNEGLVATRLGLPGVTAAAEEVVVAREVRLAELTGAAVHIQHVSTARAVALVAEAKDRGVAVTCEVTPHHLTLDDRACESYDAVFKVNPPLRTAADREALRAALVDGTIDCIATDHAPHAAHEKELEFELAPFGVVGLESALPVLVSEVIEGVSSTLTSTISPTLTWPALVERMAHAPRRILGLPAVTLSEGSVADITVIDPALELEVGERWHSKSRNCPWWGRPLRGWARHVLVDGELRLRHGEVAG